MGLFSTWKGDTSARLDNRDMTIRELKKECRDWGVAPPTKKELDYALKNKSTVPIDIVGCYDPATGILHPWQITPSSEDSEDRGYVQYR